MFRLIVNLDVLPDVDVLLLLPDLRADVGVRVHTEGQQMSPTSEQFKQLDGTDVRDRPFRRQQLIHRPQQASDEATDERCYQQSNNNKSRQMIVLNQSLVFKYIYLSIIFLCTPCFREIHNVKC